MPSRPCSHFSVRIAITLSLSVAACVPGAFAQNLPPAAPQHKSVFDMTPAERAADFCDRAKGLRDIAARDRQMAEQTSDIHERVRLEQDAQMMEGMAKSREAAANALVPGSCGPPPSATTGGATGPDVVARSALLAEPNHCPGCNAEYAVYKRALRAYNDAENKSYLAYMKFEALRKARAAAQLQASNNPSAANDQMVTEAKTKENQAEADSNAAHDVFLQKQKEYNDAHGIWLKCLATHCKDIYDRVVADEEAAYQDRIQGLDGYPPGPDQDEEAPNDSASMSGTAAGKCPELATCAELCLQADQLEQEAKAADEAWNSARGKAQAAKIVARDNPGDAAAQASAQAAEDAADAAFLKWDVAWTRAKAARLRCDACRKKQLNCPPQSQATGGGNSTAGGGGTPGGSTLTSALGEGPACPECQDEYNKMIEAMDASDLARADFLDALANVREKEGYARTHRSDPAAQQEAKDADVAYQKALKAAYAASHAVDVAQAAYNACVESKCLHQTAAGGGNPSSPTTPTAPVTPTNPPVTTPRPFVPPGTTIPNVPIPKSPWVVTYDFDPDCAIVCKRAEELRNEVTLAEEEYEAAENAYEKAALAAGPFPFRSDATQQSLDYLDFQEELADLNYHRLDDLATAAWIQCLLCKKHKLGQAFPVREFFRVMLGPSYFRHRYRPGTDPSMYENPCPDCQKEYNDCMDAVEKYAEANIRLDLAYANLDAAKMEAMENPSFPAYASIYTARQEKNSAQDAVDYWRDRLDELADAYKKCVHDKCPGQENRTGLNPTDDYEQPAQPFKLDPYRGGFFLNGAQLWQKSQLNKPDYQPYEFSPSGSKLKLQYEYNYSRPLNNSGGLGYDFTPMSCTDNSTSSAPTPAPPTLCFLNSAGSLNFGPPPTNPVYQSNLTSTNIFTFPTNAVSTDTSTFMSDIQSQIAVDGLAVPPPQAPVNVPGSSLMPNNSPRAAVHPVSSVSSQFKLVALRVRTGLSAVLPRSLRMVARAASAPGQDAGITYSIISNGKAAGQTFQLQVADPAGKVIKAHIPEGTVLLPVAPASKDASQSNAPPPDADVTSTAISSLCLEFAKRAPPSGTLYRIAPAALQQKFAPLRSLLKAGRKLADKGQFHPDSDPQDYATFIQQFAVWTKLGNWDAQKFTEAFLERSKKNAEVMNVRWTKQMEGTLRGLAPRRWQDITAVLTEADSLSKASASKPAN